MTYRWRQKGRKWRKDLSRRKTDKGFKFVTKNLSMFDTSM